jgi:hypothetical protein
LAGLLPLAEHNTANSKLLRQGLLLITIHSTADSSQDAANSTGYNHITAGSKHGGQQLEPIHLQKQWQIIQLAEKEPLGFKLELQQ